MTASVCCPIVIIDLDGRHPIDMTGQANCPCAGAPMALLAVGKSMGTILTCCITAPSKEGIAAGGLHISSPEGAKQAHGSHHVTGLAWAYRCPTPSVSPPQASQPSQQAAAAPHACGSACHGTTSAARIHTEAGACCGALTSLQSDDIPHAGGLWSLVSTGADGKVKRWRLLPGGCLQQQQQPPTQWSSRVHSAAQWFSPMGVAASGNGLMIAVASDNGTWAASYYR